MRTYTLIANNAQGASIEFGGNSLAECKRNFIEEAKTVIDNYLKLK